MSAKIRVSRFFRELSRALRTSTGENRLKTSSVDSGSSQNYFLSVKNPSTLKIPAKD